MPLSINVGLSKKSSVDYQSQGRSINVTAELDQTLLARPAELQRQIAALYQQAQEALDQAATEPAAPPPQRTNGHAKANGNGDGYANGQQNGRTEPPMTTSQRRAILAIAQRHRADPDTECLDEFGCRVSELSIRQASLFIDYLNALTESGNGSRKAGAR